MLLDLIILIAAILLGLIAANHWRKHNQSIRKGFGFTFSWWSIVDIAGGLIIAFLGILGIFLVELALGVIYIKGFFQPDSSLMTNFVTLVVYALLEELLFRSLLLSGLVTILNGRKWLSILISAILFGLVHLANPNASLVSAFGNALGGLIYGIAFLGGANLWLPLGLHFSWNFFQGPIFGFTVSGIVIGGLFKIEQTGPDWITGGAYGPEAGAIGMLFRFVIITLVFFYLQWRCQNKGDLKNLEFPIIQYTNLPIG
jgi:membrane protease YdiL (CAAX protease family)